MSDLQCPHFLPAAMCADVRCQEANKSLDELKAARADTRAERAHAESLSDILSTVREEAGILADYYEKRIEAANRKLAVVLLAVGDAVRIPKDLFVSIDWGKVEITESDTYNGDKSILAKVYHCMNCKDSRYEHIQTGPEEGVNRECPECHCPRCGGGP